jgi:hypothetical protein
MTAAALLTRDEAKAYLGGLDPFQLLQPMRFGAALAWPRAEIDAKLDALSGIDRTPPACTIYFVQAEVSRLIKIGRSFNFPRRLATLRTASPDRLNVLLALEAPREREARVHGLLALHRSHGEWFFPHPQVLDAIKQWRDLGRLTWDLP